MLSCSLLAYKAAAPAQSCFRTHGFAARSHPKRFLHRTAESGVERELTVCLTCYLSDVRFISSALAASTGSRRCTGGSSRVVECGPSAVVWKHDPDSSQPLIFLRVFGAACELRCRHGPAPERPLQYCMLDREASL